MKDLTQARQKNRLKAVSLPFLVLSQVPVAMAASVTLQWDEVSDPNVDHYEVVWGSGSGSYSSSTDAAGTSTTVSGLTDGQTYYFAVKACAAGNGDCSGYSNEVSWTSDGAQVPAAPTAEFSATPNSGTAPLQVNFSNASTGEITAYSWNFGDGTTSTARSPSHTYADAGDYTVTLTVTGPGGSTQQVMSNGIHVTPAAPVAALSANVTTGVAPLTVKFANHTTGESDAYAWTFGDGGSSGDYAPTYTYDKPGTYSVRLDATGPGGTTTDYKGGYITVLSAGPEAAFGASATTGPAPLDVQFTSESTGDITSYSWTFGDGTSSNEANPAHSYKEAGTYSVTLTVSGPDGSDSESRVGYITVTESELESGLQIEAGEAQVGRDWTTVKLEKSFKNPVVLAKPHSLQGNTPAMVQVREVTANGFAIRVREWAYLDGANKPDDVSYMVVEAGRHELPNGEWIEAGTMEIDTANVAVSFEEGFASEPVVVTTIASDNDQSGAPATVRLSDISGYGFSAALQKEELEPQVHARETVHYVALLPSSGQVDGFTYEAGRTPVAVDKRFYQIDFTSGFSSAPVFLADMQTANDLDTANVRWKAKTETYVTVLIDEEQSADKETQHGQEAVGYLALTENAGVQTAQADTE